MTKVPEKVKMVRLSIYFNNGQHAQFTIRKDLYDKSKQSGDTVRVQLAEDEELWLHAEHIAYMRALVYELEVLDGKPIKPRLVTTTGQNPFAGQD